MTTIASPAASLSRRLARSVAALLALLPLAHAADYYVSPTGSNSNAGTSSSLPWQSIARVNQQTLAAGDRVLFEGGKTFTVAGTGIGSDLTVTNPGFESDLGGWSSYGTISIVTTGVQAGAKSVAFGADGGCDQTISGWQAGKAYVFSAAMRNSGADRLTFGITVKNSSGTTIAERWEVCSTSTYREAHVVMALPTAASSVSIWFYKGGSSLSYADSVRVRELTGTLVAKTGGTASSPIIYGTYGSGSATIETKDAPGFLATNVGGIEIQDLNFTGSGAPNTDGGGAWTSTGPGISFGNLGTSSSRLSHLRIRRSNVTGYIQGVVLDTKYETQLAGFDNVLIDGLNAAYNRLDGLRIKGAHRLSTAAWNQQSHNNVTIRNSGFDYNRGDPGSTMLSGNGVHVSDTTGLVIEDSIASYNGTLNSVNNGGPVGIWISGTDSAVFQRCISHHNSTGTGNTDGGGFDFDEAVTRSTIQYCYSYENDGPGYLFFSNGLDHKENTIRYNISHRDMRKNAAGSGGLGAIHFYSNSTTSGSTSKVRVYGNTVIAADGADGAAGSAISFTPAGSVNAFSDVLVSNNVFVATGATKLVNSNSSPAITFAQNLWWSANNSPVFRWGGTNYTSLSAWRTATGKERFLNVDRGLYADPLLNNLAHSPSLDQVSGLTGLTAYQLQSGSPALNAGLDLTALASPWGPIAVGSRDFYGNTLPQGSAYDIGAHERVTSHDLSASADAESRRVGLGDGGGTVTNLATTELFIGNANNSGSACSPVFAFQLPNVGAVANPFTSATFTVGLSTSATTFNGYNADVYGLPARASSDVLAADAFAGASDTTDATKLQDNWINFNASTAVATGLKTLSNSALVAYLNAQYASGAGAGKYVFLRLSPDTAGNSWKNIKFASSEYTANTSWRPRLVVQ